VRTAFRRPKMEESTADRLEEYLRENSPGLVEEAV